LLEVAAVEPPVAVEAVVQELVDLELHQDLL
jgi:hypothetical protein